MTVNLFGRKETWIPRELWDSFEPAPVSRWKPIAACASIVALPVLAWRLDAAGLVRPNLHVTGFESTYDTVSHNLHVTWHIENHGSTDITIRRVATDGLDGTQTSTPAPAGGTALVTQDYTIDPTDCAPSRNHDERAVVHYTSWHGSHAVTTYGFGDLCDFVTDPPPG